MKRRPLTFYIVDVFTAEDKRKYTGNQLAVVRNARSLTQQEKQGIAKEMHFSETSFILDDKAKRGNDVGGGFDVRIFTPGSELPFAGHPTLGTALVIQQEIIKRNVASLCLNLRIGQIPVSISYGRGLASELWMRQINPTFEEVDSNYSSSSSRALAKVLGIGEEMFDRRFSPEVVSTGLPVTIVPLKSLNAVKRVRINQPEYSNYVKDREAQGILVFSPETYSSRNHLNARFFAESFGVAEDPATGSANGCLAGYLVKHRYFGNDRLLNQVIRVEQGYEVGRPSLLLLKAREESVGELTAATEPVIRVEVGGGARMVAKGTLL